MNAKAIAYREVRTAIAKGMLCRPETCSQCGRIDSRAADGRTLIHAHHRDYCKPLDVEWLCSKCHRAVTPLPLIIGAPRYGRTNGMNTMPESRSFGERNGYARLTEASVLVIKSRPQTARVLSEQFNVSMGAIYDIWQGRTWSWLAAAPEVT